MLKKITSVVLLFSLCFLIAGCFTINHQVGKGAQGTDKVEQRQWYVLWGLVPMTEVDSQAMAAGATDYTVQTQFSAVDVIIGIFTGIVSIQPRTVTVTK